MRSLVGLFLLCLCTANPSTTRADQVALPTPYVSVAAGGHFYFKMVPDKERGGIGTAFKVTPGARDEKLWSVSGWYAFNTFLSEDGRYLVRMGEWPPGREPSDEHLAVAFYDHGTLLAQYSTKALIKNPAAVPRSVEHYQYWNFALPHGFIRTSTDRVGHPHWFQFVTSDGIHYIFDRRTGEIVSQERYDG